MNTLEKFAQVEKLAIGIAKNNFKNLLITGDAGLGKTYGVLKAFKKIRM